MLKVHWKKLEETGSALTTAARSAHTALSNMAKEHGKTHLSRGVRELTVPIGHVTALICDVSGHKPLGGRV
jgi:hypothetical protein